MYIQMANKYVKNGQHEKSSAKNANGNHSELPSHAQLEWLFSKGQTNADEGAERTCSCIAIRNVNRTAYRKG